MKKLLTSLLLAVCVVAEAQISTPLPSPNATVSTVVGLTDVKVTYSRPKMKGRKIYGSGADFLVPFGEIWRTGANNGTVISFSDDVKFGGKDVKKGEYLVFTIPGADEWTLMLYSDVNAGALTSADYKKENEVARITAKPEKLTEKVETFTIGISDVAENNTSAKVQITWENTSVKFDVGAEYEAKVMQQIYAASEAGARYYYSTGKDLKTALDLMNVGIQADPNAFWNYHIKAQIQKKLGDNAGALATANESLTKAKAAKNDFGYVKRNEDLIKEINAEMAKAPAKKKK